MKYLILVFALWSLALRSQESCAQTPQDTLINYYLKVAKKNVEEKKYNEANDVFKKIFALKTPVPDELAYYYGVTLLNLKKYSQSKHALNKYLELQGTQAPLSAKALEALEEVDCKETGYHDEYIECDLCYGDSTLDVNCRQCKGKGIEICPVCKGSGVATSSTSFGSSYHTCQRCAGEKIVKCTSCKGKLKEKIVCYNCNGKGRKKIRRKCEE
ncbi:MAG TPA: hypothetical protein VNB90_16100 [Cytophagaceae bacterium]|nr:hypothetical protein [Cytophagaceae bacterium]